jgi:hypothetical protein
MERLGEGKGKERGKDTNRAEQSANRAQREAGGEGGENCGLVFCLPLSNEGPRPSQNPHFDYSKSLSLTTQSRPV